MGFAHQGGGWKNREFFGHIYSFDVVPTDDDDQEPPMSWQMNFGVF